ncbi:MAG TPA: AraC family transcriptional regulator [Ideonella sp.]|uniref:AraC family transcriptional regulator n=1 Tax=Ideonella sp. TaxID=1929293 RepID=UPI002C620B1E|nr:AraC family transcriptional regulator [Ideonella sp.]HSI51378.1 AraC family transcriptional regulator [Ideonella sp.]
MPKTFPQALRHALAAAGCLLALAAPLTSWSRAAVPEAAASAPSAASAPADPVALDARVEGLKSDVIQLNRDLLLLEEELLFPASTQVAVFVSSDVGDLFMLDSVQVLLDGKEVGNHLYTERELVALRRGGVQRFYLGNLRSGEHTLVAFFVGKGPHERDYKRGTTLKFEKGSEPKYVELQIKDSARTLQPVFDVKVWQ